MSQASRPTRDLPDGVVVGEALSRAVENLESHRATALRLIDQAIDDLADEGSQASHEVLARLSDSIGGLAGMFQLDALSQAAKQLGGIVRALEERGTSNPELIGLHIAALRVVRALADTDDADEILRGLNQIGARAARRPGLRSV